MFWFTRNDLDMYQNASGTVNALQVEKSKGNYVEDADGNTMLDLVSGSHNPLGYNHDIFRDVVIGKGAIKLDQPIFNSVDAGCVASGDFVYARNETLNKIKPDGLEGVTLVSEQNATAAAVKDAMLKKAAGESAGFSALYFHGSQHGSPLTLGGMICGWPTAAYPSSADEESHILESVRNTMERMAGSSPVAAIVIEPTQQSTGYSASADFVKTLRRIANDFDASIVIDETNTCAGASGQGFWQHETSAKPDYVTFGGRLQASGFFSKAENGSIAGSENDLALLDLICKAVEQDGLVHAVKTSANALSTKVGSMQVRGVDRVVTSGTSVWLHCESNDTATSLVTHLADQGVLTSAVGDVVTMKPSLLFGENQVQELAGALAKF